jgi:hypothetical protein
MGFWGDLGVMMFPSVSIAHGEAIIASFWIVLAQYAFCVFLPFLIAERFSVLFHVLATILGIVLLFLQIQAHIEIPGYPSLSFYVLGSLNIVLFPLGY